ncbi:MAG TPA: hypothetical protein VJN70_10390 [Gemmatimonadaceae bacterium]|nr:hypothetical protein [Gemmatimonadaceae bacterium]
MAARGTRCEEWEAPMRVAMNPWMNEYLVRGFIALALVFFRVKLGALVPRRIGRR